MNNNREKITFYTNVVTLPFCPLEWLQLKPACIHAQALSMAKKQFEEIFPTRDEQGKICFIACVGNFGTLDNGRLSKASDFMKKSFKVSVFEKFVA